MKHLSEFCLIRRELVYSFNIDGYDFGVNFMQDHQEKPVIVIGAGPAGLSCATRLAENGFSVLILESSPHIGGLSRSISLWGRKVDLGPHRFFTQHKVVQRFWERFLNNDFERIRRITRIYYRGSFFQYPIEPLDVIKNLKFNDLALSILSYLLQKIRVGKKINSFEDFVTNRFGRRLYKMFFQTYTEKVWGISCTKIDAEWAFQRIGSFSLSQAVKNALKITGNAPRTLLKEFFYPVGGAGIVYERMVEEVLRKGGGIRLKAPVKNILLTDEGVVEGVQLHDGERIYCSHLVSTMPITNLISGLKNVPENVESSKNKLRFRSTILIYLRVESPSIFSDQWIYVQNPDLKLGRITNFNNWTGKNHECGENGNSNQLQSFSILCLEYWCFENSDFWKKDDKELTQLAEFELRTLQLFPPTTNVSDAFVIKIPKSYPLYELGYKTYLNEIYGFLNKIPNLFAIGRYGSFQYNNQDHSILMGLKAAEKIISKNKFGDLGSDPGSGYLEESRLSD